MTFQSLRKERFSQETTRESAEEKYWKKFRVTPKIQLTGSVVGVAFNPTTPFDFALAAGTRVCLYDGRSGNLKRSFSRFKDIAYGAAFRHDGKLLAAGCKDNHVYVYESENGTLLRMLKGHKRPVRNVGWSMTGSSLLTCSDDSMVKYWDVSTESLVNTYKEHQDQVRCCSLFSSENESEKWITGSYDHTVRLWDVRLPSKSSSVHNFQHDGPLEAVLGLKGTYVLGAAGNTLRVWDLRTGSGTTLKDIQDHQKTITCLFNDGGGARVVSGSLDGLLKVHDSVDFSLSASVPIGSGVAILSANMSKDNQTLIVGTVSGSAIVRKRVVTKKAAVKEEDEIRGGSKRYFMRGGNLPPSRGDIQVGSEKRVQRLAKYDAELRKFNYKAALDKALKSYNPTSVTSVLEELMVRGGLEASLSGRDDSELEPLMSFLSKHVIYPRYSSVLVPTCDTLLKLYSSELGQRQALAELFLKMQTSLNVEIKVQQNLQQIAGTLDALLGSCTRGSVEGKE